MPRYLLNTNEIGAFVDIPAGESSDAYGRIQVAFAKQHGTEDYATLDSIDETTPNGIDFHWGLAGPGGAYFVLYLMPHNTAQDIEDAKRWIRANRDASRITVLHIRKLVEFDITPHLDGPHHAFYELLPADLPAKNKAELYELVQTIPQRGKLPQQATCDANRRCHLIFGVREETQSAIREYLFADELLDVVCPWMNDGGLEKLENAVTYSVLDELRPVSRIL